MQDWLLKCIALEDCLLCQFLGNSPQLICMTKRSASFRKTLLSFLSSQSECVHINVSHKAPSKGNRLWRFHTRGNGLEWIKLDQQRMKRTEVAQKKNKWTRMDWNGLKRNQSDRATMWNMHWNISCSFSVTGNDWSMESVNMCTPPQVFYCLCFCYFTACSYNIKRNAER